MSMLAPYLPNPMPLGSNNVPTPGSNATMSTNGMMYSAFP